MAVSWPSHCQLVGLPIYTGFAGNFPFIGIGTEASQEGLFPSIVLAHILITSPARPCPKFQQYIVYSWLLVSLLALHF